MCYTSPKNGREIFRIFRNVGGGGCIAADKIIILTARGAVTRRTRVHQLVVQSNRVGNARCTANERVATLKSVVDTLWCTRVSISPGNFVSREYAAWDTVRRARSLTAKPYGKKPTESDCSKTNSRKRVRSPSYRIRTACVRRLFTNKRISEFGKLGNGGRQRFFELKQRARH